MNDRQSTMTLALPSQKGLSEQYARTNPEAHLSSSDKLRKKKKPKPAGTRYSKLAQLVTKLKEKDDEPSIASLDSSISSINLNDSEECVVTFEKNQDFGKKKSSIFKSVAQKMTGVKPGSNHGINSTATACCEAQSSKKVATKSYSRLAFSVQDVGSLRKKRRPSKIPPSRR